MIFWVLSMYMQFNSDNGTCNTVGTSDTWLVLHTCQHLEIRNQDIFTILAERVPKARAASARTFSRGCRGMSPENFLNFLCLESLKIPQIY